MSWVRIAGPEQFVEKLVENWRNIKPFLPAGKTICIFKHEHLKVDARLTIDNEIIINCDDPTPENIKPLMNLVRAQSTVRPLCEETIKIIMKVHIKQVSQLAQYNDFESFIQDYNDYMRKFWETLIICLEKTLALDALPDEDRSTLESLMHMKNPLSDEVADFEKSTLYIVILDNLWRRKLGWEIPKFAMNKGVDVKELEQMFKRVLEALQFKDIISVRDAAEAVTALTLRIFGIQIDPKKKVGKRNYIS
ncbi:MAG: hypothetical protein QXL77_06520 [Candidatus Bathyarchaeia archaeon]